MHRSVLVFLILFVVVTANGQLATYSESIPYTPRVLKANKNKDKKAGSPAAKQSAAAPASGSTLTIPVSVFSGTGALLTGFQPADFKVFLNDTEAEIVSVETRPDPITVAVVIDMSPSTAEQIVAVKSVGARLATRLRPTDSVVVVGFNNNITMVKPSSDRNEIFKAIKELKMGDGTAIYSTVKKLFEEQAKGSYKLDAIVIITDGVDTTSRNAGYESSLQLAETAVTTIYPIYFDTSVPAKKLSPAEQDRVKIFQNSLPPGIGGMTIEKDAYERGRWYLEDLLTLSGGRTIMTGTVLSGATASLDSIPVELTSRYYVTFRLPHGRKPGDRHQIKVRVNRPGLSVRTKGSYVEMPLK